ncbi:MAG TPA: hypothetical protein VHP34_11020 [Alphaproteobacteria bacterium]|nr:hypothetical protein [Alphaproteobacteria bacterium]
MTLNKIIEKTHSTWNAMKAEGVTEETPISLDLLWHAKDSTMAKDLAAKLAEETSISVDAQPRGEQWVVLARVGPKKFTLEKLENLVKNMHKVGAVHDCVFDGWQHAAQDEPSPAGEALSLEEEIPENNE